MRGKQHGGRNAIAASAGLSNANRGYCPRNLAAFLDLTLSSA